MRSLIIYKSIHHGNTHMIAAAMAETLKADILQPHEVEACKIGEYGLIGFGSGIYNGRHHIELLRLVEGLPPANKKAFIFSTHGIGPVSTYHRALKKRLLRKGFSIVGEFSCRGYDTNGLIRLIGGLNRGRPDEQDLERARDFVKDLMTLSLD